MTRKPWWIVGGILAAAAAAAGGAATAHAGLGRTDLPASHGSSPASSPAGTDTDPEESAAPVTGDALARAGSAALTHIGGGRVTETEVGDEEGFYEVEVTRADGSQVDVHLNERLVVLGSKADQEDGR